MGFQERLGGVEGTSFLHVLSQLEARAGVVVAPGVGGWVLLLHPLLLPFGRRARLSRDRERKAFEYA
jgi:hypothetical protein